MPDPIHIDLTEIVDNPVRSGIQRVERELIRNWPGELSLLPCRFDPRRQAFQLLPTRVFDILTAESKGGREAVARDRKRLTDLATGGAPLARDRIRLLNLELFYDPHRADAYRRIYADDAIRPFWVVMDFLPFLSPHLFPSGTTRHCMHFIRAVREIREIGFISAQVRDDYTRCITRRPAGNLPVFPLGGDGLGTPAQFFDAGKRAFVVVGTVEPRKNLVPVLQAFGRLWRDGSSAELIVAGNLSPTARQEIALLDAMQSDRRLTRLHQASDAQLRDVLGRARATIFVSDGEGFGLPPFESLHAGIPTIVGAAIPSIALLPPLGQIRLDTVSPETIAASVTQMTDDAFAARLWQDAARLRVPTWRDFAQDVAMWIRSA